MPSVSRLLSAACLGIAMTAFAASSMGGEYAPVRKAPAQAATAKQGGRVIVKFRDRTQVLSAATAGGARMGPQAAEQMAARLGVALVDGRVMGVRTQVLKSSALGSAALAARLAQEADVEWAEVDQRRFALAAPSDPLYPDNLTTATPVAGQWYLRAPGGAVKSGVDIETAWNVTHGAGIAVSNPIVIADVDTGITVHPDLVNKVLPGYDFIGYNTDNGEGIVTANDGDGPDADPSDPGDWFSQADENSGQFDSSCNVLSDSSWHGTQTAGILGAQTNNGVGMAGTAYDTMIVPVRALGKCGGFDSDIIVGALWAAGVAVSGTPANAHPARVINMSLGGSGGCTASYSDAIVQLNAVNALIVAAAGNDGLAVGAPANCAGVIGVAGLRHTGSKVGFSDLGPEITIASPGGNCVNTDGTQACLYPILTTSNTGTTVPGAATYSNSFQPISVGTSFAAPVVAGTVALMLSANPGLTNAQVISLLKSSASAFPTSSDSAGVPVCQAPTSVAQDECLCTTTTCGAGMLNAGLAVQLAAGATGGVAVVSDPGAASVGDTVVLDGGASVPSAGATIVDYQWTVTDGAAVVSISPAQSTANAATAGRSSALAAPAATTSGSSAIAVQALGVGTATIKLVTTDSAGKLGVSYRTVTIVSSTPTATISGVSALAVGGSLGVSGTSSTAPASHTIVAYAWQLTSGVGIVSLGSNSGANITLTGLAPGTATLQLTVTDDAGTSASTSTDVTVTVASSSSDGGGGGATSPLWLAGLAVAGLLLTRRRRPR